ncbi:uncharacterized protein TRIVIDRAFT_187445 [Trichoderma virens Gv29-8]|uniref:Uncharacterized protein n=1 Tax=Hypocrea virens (strain Gv29-8 / FGSC 10586) TaxID=413071 RepID=G9N9L5_HYPVG|nr:uncharacterized protein TRIVIDRAFT_187445 [Trichoderma virens Gv29-8]EHK16633.1 hypothetical protein TRIVIDRAFT_187445 [Trichoderma virens Gv29-8]
MKQRKTQVTGLYFTFQSAELPYLNVFASTVNPKCSSCANVASRHFNMLMFFHPRSSQLSHRPQPRVSDLSMTTDDIIRRRLFPPSPIAHSSRQRVPTEY